MKDYVCAILLLIGLAHSAPQLREQAETDWSPITTPDDWIRIQSPTTEKFPQSQESTAEPITESTIQSLTSDKPITESTIIHDTTKRPTMVDNKKQNMLAFGLMARSSMSAEKGPIIADMPHQTMMPTSEQNAQLYKFFQLKPFFSFQATQILNTRNNNNINVKGPIKGYNKIYQNQNLSNIRIGRSVTHY